MIKSILAGKIPVVVKQVTAGTSFPDTDLDRFTEHQIAYQVHPWIYSCVRVIATNASQAEWAMFKRTEFSDGDLTYEISEKQPQHHMTQLFRKPNPMMRLSSFDLRNLTYGYLELDGNAYWYIQRDPQTKMAQAIIPLRPDRVTPVPDKEQFIKGYLYRIDGEVFALLETDVVHIKNFNPQNDYLGQSTMAAARTTLTEDTFAIQYNTQFYKKGARPGGALTFDQQLTKDQRTAIREEWRIAHEGAANAHKIAVFERGADWKSYGISQVDSSFIEGRKLNREGIAGVFGVPPVLINSYEHANYNTAQTQTQVFWRTTIQPKLMCIGSAIDIQQDKFMGPIAAGLGQEVFTGYVTDAVWALQQELREGVESHVKLVNNGIMNRNEVRSKFYNLAPVDGGENFFRPAGQSPITDTEVGPADQEQEEETAQIVGREIKLVASTNERRKAVWKQFADRTEFLEKLFARFVLAIFKAQREEIEGRLLKFDEATEKRAPKSEIEVEAILFSLDKAIEETAEAAGPIYTRLMNEGGTAGMGLVGVGATFNLDNPTAQRIMRDKLQKFAKSINETTWKRTKESLVEGMKAGEGIKELTSRVGSVMKVRGVKALEIARTEVIGTYNGGLLEAFDQVGDEVKGKEWLAVQDDETRDSHSEIDGERIPVKHRFEVQDPPALLHPGDPAGAASEIINCRCTLLPVLEEL